MVRSVLALRNPTNPLTNVPLCGVIVLMTQPNDDFDTVSAEEYYREAGFGDVDHFSEDHDPAWEDDIDHAHEAFREAQDILHGG